MERKFFKLMEFKADAEARTVEGWASTFGNTDSYGDVIAPGAFMDSLKAKMPKMLWQHDSAQPIGVWTSAQETAQGLYVTGTLADTTLGNDVYKLAQMGAIDSMSIGFSIEQYSYDTNSTTRTIQKVDLWEVSLVTFPANDLAKITGVKSKPETIRQFEDFLREAGYSREDATTIALRGFKALTPEREAPAIDLERLATLFNQFSA